MWSGPCFFRGSRESGLQLLGATCTSVTYFVTHILCQETRMLYKYLTLSHCYQFELGHETSLALANGLLVTVMEQRLKNVLGKFALVSSVKKTARSQVPTGPRVNTGHTPEDPQVLE